MIAVVTKDGTNEEKTMKAAEVIRSLGISEPLIYKLDVYSALNIFRGNVYNIRPTIYKYTH
jgi:hypothetical protein